MDSIGPAMPTFAWACQPKLTRWVCERARRVVVVRRLRTPGTLSTLGAILHGSTMRLLASRGNMGRVLAHGATTHVPVCRHSDHLGADASSIPLIIFPVAGVVFRVVCATVTFFWGENLFWKGGALYLLGSTLLWKWSNPRLASVRAALHLPAVRAAGVGAALYILAAVFMGVGAATRLHPILAAFVIVPSLMWIIFSTQLLRSVAAQRAESGLDKVG